MRARSAAVSATQSGPGRRVGLPLAALTLLVAGSMASAEPLGRHIELTQFGGYTLFGSDRNSLTGTDLKNAIYLGGHLGYELTGWLAVEAAAGFAPAQEDVANGADIDFWHLSGNAVLHPYRTDWGWPYVSAGMGVSRLKFTDGGGDTQGNGEIAAGLQVWLNDAIGVRLDVRDIMWTPKEDVGTIKSNDYVVGAGLTFALGARPRDTDGDGVPDRRDACPATPKGAKVDDKGCPLDSDGDGVFDGLDQCEGTPKGAKVDAKGCPLDSDGDGVADGLDQCEGTPKGAKVDDKGCPLDADGDGVADGLDQCEKTPEGCTVDVKGCPLDADGDGVCDGLDRCPDTPKSLHADSTGCPSEIRERETELQDTGSMRLADLPSFETGTANLRPEAKVQLDVVGRVLVQWPELRFEIAGHTESRGSARQNQKLSEARANAVLAYLLQAFPVLKSEQFVAKGYGGSRPIVPGASPEAAARNRRIELTVLNKDALMREIERRRLLEKSDTK